MINSRLFPLADLNDQLVDFIADTCGFSSLEWKALLANVKMLDELNTWFERLSPEAQVNAILHLECRYHLLASLVNYVN